MSNDELRVDLAEAIGKASASLCLNAAIVAALVARGALSREDAATLAAHATEALRATAGLSDDAKEIGETCLRGYSRSWTRLVARN
jgi:predicted transcriptional regulator